jgi:dTDP-4-dehydrorhamnose 3,5-epimerase-like enzyme
MNSVPQQIQLPKILDSRGNLTFIEGNRHIPFEIKRSYWIYDVPGGEVRGAHAFKEQDEFIIALSGSFDVVVDNGCGKKETFLLNRSYFGLFVPRGNWRQMENFSTNSLALVLASTTYDSDDYIRSYDEFSTFVQSNNEKEHLIENVNKVMFNSSGLASESLVSDCVLYELDKNHRNKGNITVIENRDIIPFDIERVYYLYDVPGGEERGGHAHKDLYQLIVAGSGSFDVILDDGNQKRTITLNRPYQGLYIVPGIWRELVNFSSGSSCLVLASHKYDETDYIRDYCEFEELKKGAPKK